MENKKKNPEPLEIILPSLPDLKNKSRDELISYIEKSELEYRIANVKVALVEKALNDLRHHLECKLKALGIELPDMP
jgi:hypothetical protein